MKPTNISQPNTCLWSASVNALPRNQSPSCALPPVLPERRTGSISQWHFVKQNPPGNPGLKDFFHKDLQFKIDQALLQHAEIYWPQHDVVWTVHITHTIFGTFFSKTSSTEPRANMNRGDTALKNNFSFITFSFLVNIFMFPRFNSLSGHF